MALKKTKGVSLSSIRGMYEYTISGNVEQSAIKAGYSDKYARSSAHKLVAKVGIADYIADRMEEIKSSKIMDQTEVMERLTAIARGELKTGVYNYIEKANYICVGKDNAILRWAVR